MGYRRFWEFGLHLSLVALLVSGTGANGQNRGAGASWLTAAVSHDGYANDVGHYLAGLAVAPSSPLAQFEDNAAWATHQHDLDEAWNQMETERVPAMRLFQHQELDDPSLAHSVVFYPFSGPDVLTVTLFFPQSPVYVLVGLEPAGTLPGPQQFEGKDLGDYLAATRDTLASELGRSFFITRQMDRQFRGQVTDGLCLPILELLTRSHYTVLGFRYVRLDDGGQVIDRPANYHAAGGEIGNKGVEIEFRSDADQSVHKLFYFSVNLADSRLGENKPFLKFVATLQGCTTFLKATSYMLHHPGFSTIRQQVLARSAAVLQDDSGIPYHFYLSRDWRVQLYGEYVKPYGSFGYMAQPDLRNAYLTDQPKPLAFRIGYGYHAVPSNLLLAMKTK